jgi:dTMP kinase
MKAQIRFVVLEGIDGSGTTTQLDALATRLRASGQTVITTREPTSGPVGVLLRKILEGKLDAGESSSHFDWVTLALLFAADRAHHVHSVIRPSLERGHIVICDRYDLSSRIYQSVTSPDPQTALPWVCTLNERAPRPDITFVLDVDAELAEKRRVARGGKAELFEQTALQRRLARAYSEAHQYVPNDRLKHVPGDRTIEQVTELLYQACHGST